MNGMNGWSILSRQMSTWRSTASVAARPSPFRLTFASSIYQSQNSLHDEIVNLLRGQAEVVILKVVALTSRIGVVQAGEDPLVGSGRAVLPTECLGLVAAYS